MADVKKRRTKLGCLMCPPPPRGAPRCPPRWADNQLVDVREIAGLSTPWQFDAAGPEVLKGLPKVEWYSPKGFKGLC